MSCNLIIVESPVKAKTIANYLGKAYVVVSCNGHIRDLPTKERAVNVDDGFTPTYVIKEDKKEIVASLRKLADKATSVYLASDEDREGEAVAWHLKVVLDLKPEKARRIVFREITKAAICKSLEHPRGIDYNLVYAQQARRILDRLVGYDVSPVLWKKVNAGLSAGRVQSVAVKLVVERERAIHAFASQSNYKVTAQLLSPGQEPVQAELVDKLATQEKAREFLTQCQSATYVVQALEAKKATQSPSPPFMTSTLQQEAGQKLSYPVNKTMRLAQQLYEEGRISYMRTDALALSQEALAGAEKMIRTTYSAAHHKRRVYTTKSATAQQAHEAIRPTDFSQRVVSTDPDIQRLYKLIWQRAIASQMADAILERTTATVGISTVAQRLLAKDEVVVFKGFLDAYDADAKDASKLPALEKGDLLNLIRMQARESFTKAPARYTEATLVRELKEREIGRPSTYAPIISTIQKRGYVLKESRSGEARTYHLITLEKGQIKETKQQEIVGAEKNKLFPTDTAMVVNDFLVKHFTKVTDYDFTAQVEKQLDAIANKQQAWQVMLADFYKDLAMDTAKALEVDSHTVQRMLGTDPATGKTVIARLSKRYGPFVQLGLAEDEQDKPRFASLLKGQFLEQLTLEDALKLLALPRELGVFEQATVIVNRGRYGPYVRHKEQCYALGKSDDPYGIELSKAIDLIEARRKQVAQSQLKTFPEDTTIQVCNGPWGPYIKTPGKNVRLPQGEDPHTLTLARCKQLIQDAPKRRRRGVRSKSRAAAKSGK